MWIDTGSARLPDGVEDELTRLQLSREDRTDHTWLNLDSGAVVMVICVGGWRRPAQSQYQVYYRAPGSTSLFDVTFALSGGNSWPFDTDETGADTYDAVRKTLIRRVGLSLRAASLFDDEAVVR